MFWIILIYLSYIGYGYCKTALSYGTTIFFGKVQVISCDVSVAGSTSPVKCYMDFALKEADKGEIKGGKPGV